MKRLLIILMMVMGIIQAHAKEAYGVFNNGTLTLYYDDARSSRSGTVYSVPNGECSSIHYLFTEPYLNVSGGHPWHEKAKETTKIVFDTSFQQYEPTSTFCWFAGFFNVQEIVGIGNLNTSHITNMEYMFAGCDNLTNLDLSGFIITEGIESSRLCYACNGLTSLQLGNSIEFMENDAFRYCTSLESVTIPKSVKNIGEGAFMGCYSLSSVKVEEGNTYFDTRNDCNALINSSTNKLIIGTRNTTVPSSVTSIGVGAFMGIESIESINLPNSIASIGDRAFRNCKGLKTLKLPTALTDIGERAFSGCIQIQTIDIPNSVKSIGERAFYGCNSLTIINSLITTPFDIPSDCFSEETKENTVLNIPSGTMPLYEAAKGWNEFVNIVDPSGLNKKEIYAFYNDGVLTYCYDTEKGNRAGTIFVLTEDNIRVDASDATKVVFESSFSNVKPTTLLSLFEYYSSLEEIVGLEYLNTNSATSMRQMFNRCEKLKKIDVRHFDTQNVTGMTNMFADCGSLEHLDLSSFDTQKVADMSNMILFNSSLYPNKGRLTSLTIGPKFTPKRFFFSYGRVDKVISKITNPTNIPTDCFPDEVKKSTYLIVPLGTKALYEAAEGWKEFKYIYEGEDKIKEAYAEFKDGTLTIRYDNQKNNRSGDIFELSVKTNTGGYKAGWEDVKAQIVTIVIDKSFKEFEMEQLFKSDYRVNWFTDCKSLKDIQGLKYFNTEVLTDMECMFNGCSSLTDLDLSCFNTENVTSMDTMFGGCTNLVGINLSSFNVEKVTDMRGMFDSCTSLKHVNLSNFNTSSLTRTAVMFSGCGSLTSLDLSSFKTDKVKDMSSMFSYCNSLTNLTIGKDFTQFPEKLFADCKNLSSFTTLIEEPFDIPSNCFADNVKANATLRVPKGTVALYQAKEGWKEFAHITDEEGLDPIDANDNVDYGNGSGINGDTDLNGNVIGNIYYNISDENGEYSSTEGCIILKKSSTDNSMEGKDLFDEDLKNNFTGIILMVQGSGTIKVNEETVGNMTLKVKIGNSAPITLELEGKMKASFPYSVTEPTYVYIYGGETQTANARELRAASSGNALKIYGIEWSDEYEINGIETIETRTDKAVIYNLHGQRMQTVTKGINIINGKKVMVK